MGFSSDLKRGLCPEILAVGVIEKTAIASRYGRSALSRTSKKEGNQSTPGAVVNLKGGRPGKTRARKHSESKRNCTRETVASKHVKKPKG